MSDVPLKILCLALTDGQIDFVRSIANEIEVQTCQSEDDFDETYESFEDGHFAFVLCGSVLGVGFGTEAAQVLNCQCPMTPTFFVTEDPNEFKPKDLVKNGFQDAFLYPADKESLRMAIADCLSEESLSERILKPVKIVDLDSAEELGFDTHVFLPLNKKYVRYSKAEEPLAQSKIDKLNKHSVGSLHIDHKDMKAFYSYSAKRLKRLGQDGEISSTEREGKLRKAVSGLFSEIFDSTAKDSFDSGKTLLANSQKIISNYITGGKTDNWYASLVRSVGAEKGSYPHSSEVSTFAALFALGLGHSQPEDLALAGFLHDISLVQLSKEDWSQSREGWSEEDQSYYLEHPQKTVNTIKNKKMIINSTVEKAVLDHHEKFDGTGFPKGKVGDLISEEAQILSFADQFQYLMTPREGQKRLTPLDAFLEIEKTGSIGRNLMGRIRKLLDPASDSEGEQAA